MRLIADEAERLTGTLVLRGLGLDRLPDTLFDLTHLQVLDLGTPDWRSNQSSINRIDAQREQFGRLIHLKSLSVVGSDLASLVSFQTMRSLEQLDWTLAHKSPGAVGVRVLAGIEASR
ncbi:hypothetical protein ABNQ38_31905 [Azospirillum sp. A29]|uniref:hypothetical protein n=1 Tax=Azospirillum sp. A29 TaxID=3160606 RepID=UPI00366BCB1A